MSSDTVHETPHLSVDYLDRVWLHRLGDGPVGPHYVGHVDEDPPWPKDMGAEPNWWLTEVDELLDAWEDACKYGWECQEEARDTYRRNQI